MIKYFFCAVRFLTIFPLGKSVEYTGKDLARSMSFYPVVGTFIGGVSLGCFYMASQFVAPVQATVFAFIFGIIVTGALHLDGFADTCDGFYAGKTKKEILEIMKDSHIGTMAVVGLFCLLILKLSLLLSLLSRGVLTQALLLTPALGRWVMVVATSLYPYARSQEGTAKPFIEEISWKEVTVASLFLFILAYFQMRQSGILVVLSVLIVGIFILRWMSKKVDGITGDILGALNEVSEVACLILMHWIIPIPKEVWTI